MGVSSLGAPLEVVRAALRDPFYPVQAAGEQLVAAFHLSLFRKRL